MDGGGASRLAIPFGLVLAPISSEHASRKASPPAIDLGRFAASILTF